MKKLTKIFMALVLGAFLLQGCGNGSPSPEEKAKIIKAYEDSLVMAKKAKQESIVNSDLKDKKITNIPKNETILNFKQLYPILKKCLLEIVCESYRIEEDINSLSAYSKESDSSLSSWSWDFNNQPLKIKTLYFNELNFLLRSTKMERKLLV